MTYEEHENGYAICGCGKHVFIFRSRVKYGRTEWCKTEDALMPIKEDVESLKSLTHTRHDAGEKSKP